MSDSFAVICSLCLRPLATGVQWANEHNNGEGCECEECIAVCWGVFPYCMEVAREREGRSDVTLRCQESGNQCGTDTVACGCSCECTPCRQWQAAFDQGRGTGLQEYESDYHRAVEDAKRSVREGIAFRKQLDEANAQIERYKNSIAITDRNVRRMQRVIDVARRQKQRSIALTAALNELLTPTAEESKQ